MKSMKKRAYRNLASFGKRQEFIAISELLKRGFDVYIPLVDDQQVDCIIKKTIDGKPVYIDIQIKARSKNCKLYDAARFSALTVNPRQNYFFIFYSEHLDTYWVIPSLDLVKIASQCKKGKNKGKYSINLALWSKSRGIRKNPKFKRYENNFKLLEDYAGE